MVHAAQPWIVAAALVACSSCSCGAKSAPEKAAAPTMAPEPEKKVLVAPTYAFDEKTLFRAMPESFQIDEALVSLFAEEEEVPTCSATMATTGLVLTARHCFFDDFGEGPPFSSVRFGDHYASIVGDALSTRPCLACLWDYGRDLATVRPTLPPNARGARFVDRSLEEMPDMVLWGFSGQVGRPLPRAVCGKSVHHGEGSIPDGVDPGDSGGPLVALFVDELGARVPVVVGIATQMNASFYVRFSAIDRTVLDGLGASAADVVQVTAERFESLCP